MAFFSAKLNCSVLCLQWWKKQQKQHRRKLTLIELATDCHHNFFPWCSWAGVQLRAYEDSFRTSPLYFAMLVVYTSFRCRIPILSQQQPIFQHQSRLLTEFPNESQFSIELYYIYRHFTLLQSLSDSDIAQNQRQPASSSSNSQQRHNLHDSMTICARINPYQIASEQSKAETHGAVVRVEATVGLEIALMNFWLLNVNASIFGSTIRR